VPSPVQNEYYALFSIDDVSALTQRIRDYKLMRDQALEEVEQRKKAETALMESETKLIELNATKDKFFSIIAHDLKNPIGAFMNVSDLLASMYDTFSKNEVLEILSEINSYAKRLFSLLENLLIWSRSQTGKIEINPNWEKLGMVVSNCILILNLSAENKNIHLFNDIDPGISIFADVNMLTTVIRNLMSNAIKFTLPGGEVRVSAVEDKNFVEVIIYDTGIGMNPETVSKLFRIDQHLSTLGTNNEKGSGLGLILCKEFIEKHNGRIWVISKEGVGSSFHFTVPSKEVS
jgi:two-component system, sensor histidine kinase and response regulator